MPSQPPSSPLSIAFIVRDPLPPIRADVLTLFGAEMPRYGVHTELVGQGGSEAPRRRGRPAACTWWAACARASPASARRCGTWSACGAPCAQRPDCLQVRDKIASGVLGRVMAALLRVPFVYWMSFPIVEGFEVRRDDIARQERGLKGRLKWAAHALRARASRIAIYRLVLPGARHIFVQSDAMADWLARKVSSARA
jgi:hypothetical protein